MAKNTKRKNGKFRMIEDTETATGNVTEKEIKKFSKRIPIVMNIDEDIAAARFKYRQQDEATAQAIVTAATNDHEEAKSEFKTAQDKEAEAKKLLNRKKQLIKKPNSTPIPEIDSKIDKLTVKELRAKFIKKRNKRWAAKELMEKTAKEVDNLLNKETLNLRKEGEVWKDGNIHKMEWCCAPKYVENVMPDKENPSTVYVAIRHQLMNNTFTITAEQAIKNLDRFYHAIPDDWPVFKRYIAQISKEMNDQKSKSHFDRRQGLNLLSMSLKKSHQILFDVYLHRNKNNASLQEPFDANTLKKMELYRTQNLTGDAQILPIGHQTTAKRAILNAYTDGKLKPKVKAKEAKKDKKMEKTKTKFQTDGGPTKKRKEKKTTKKEKASRKEGVRTGESPELSSSKRQKLIDKMDTQGLQALMRAAKGIITD